MMEPGFYYQYTRPDGHRNPLSGPHKKDWLEKYLDTPGARENVYRYEVFELVKRPCKLAVVTRMEIK